MSHRFTSLHLRGGDFTKRQKFIKKSFSLSPTKKATTIFKKQISASLQSYEYRFGIYFGLSIKT